MFFYYINLLMTAFLTIFRRFPKFSKIVPKARRTFPNIFREFPKITEDVRRFPVTVYEENETCQHFFFYALVDRSRLASNFCPLFPAIKSDRLRQELLDFGCFSMFF